MVQRLEIGDILLGSVPTRNWVGTSPWSFQLLMLASLPISRIIVRMQHSGAVIPRGMTLERRQEICGTLVPTMPPV